MELRLRKYRERRGWTLTHLTQLTGIAANDVSMLERGQRPPFPGWRRRSAAASGLLAHHAGVLAASAIAPAVAQAHGYRSVTAEPQLEALGFAPAQRRVPTLLVPIHGVSGAVVLHQHRPDVPRTVKGKVVKYETV